MRVTPGPSRIDVSWDVPAADDPKVDSYEVVVTPEDRLVHVTHGRTGTSVSDLTNGIEYTVTVRAKNARGFSVASHPVKVTPALADAPEVAGLIVKYEPGVAVTEGNGRATGDRSVDDVALLPDVALGSGIRTVELSQAVSEERAEDIAKELEADPRVKWAEPDYVVHAFSAPLPNDPYYAYGAMWGLTGTYGIQAAKAWSVTQGSPDVVVAVIDTGITGHPDLAGRTVPGYDMVTDPSRSGDGDGRDSNPTDTGGNGWHGTHVAGTIAATANNGLGVVGVAPQVKVQPVRVLGANGGGTISDILAGITWASGGIVDGLPRNPTPARVLNLSLGGPFPCSSSPAFQTVIDEAVGRGATIVAAAGNSAADASGFSPASCRNVVTVGATGTDGRRASFSNYGPDVDISAPGVEIWSTSNTGTTSVGSPAYSSYQGTSMAAPHVAGVAALMVSQNPSLTPAQVENRLRTASLATPFPAGSCDPAGWRACGAGIVNAASQLGVSASVPVTGVTISPTSTELVLGSATQITATVLPSGATQRGLRWTSSNPAVAAVSSTGVVTAISAGIATISATTTDGGFSAHATVSVVAARVGHIILTPTMASVGVGKAVTIRATVYPSAAARTPLTWTSSATSVAVVNPSGVVTGRAPGISTIVASTADGRVAARATVTVLTPVSGISVAPTTARMAAGETLRLTPTIVPANAGNKAVTWMSSQPAVAAVGADGRVTAMAPGSAVITATTGDGGFRATSTITVVRTPVSSISLAPAAVSMGVGQSRSLGVTVSPSNATDKTVTWASANPAVVAVSADGIVKAVAPGSAVVTATTRDGGRQARATVTVVPVVTGVVVSPAMATIAVGQSSRLSAAVLPAAAPNRAVSWSTSNSRIATVGPDGTVVGRSTGSAVITAVTAEGQFRAAARVSVVVPVTGVTVVPGRQALPVGGSVSLGAVITPGNATYRSVTWSSSDPKVATVSAAGRVSALAQGTATITALASDGLTRGTASIVVTSRDVTGVALSTSSVAVPTGRSTQISASVSPSYATQNGVAWTSSNPSVATVRNGLIYGVSSGSAVITATTVQGGFTATANVSVFVAVSGVQLPRAFSMPVNSTRPLAANVLPANAANKAVRWSSSNTRVAAVTADGVVSGKAIGTASITATTLDGGFSAHVTVSVTRPPATGVTVAPQQTKVAQGRSVALTATVIPVDAPNRSVLWSSSNPRIATVDSQGVVRGLAAGSATITATTVEGGHRSSAQVEVVAPVATVTTLSASKVMDIRPGIEYITVKARVTLPSGAAPATSVPVYFWREFGGTYNGGTKKIGVAWTDANGVATVSTPLDYSRTTWRIFGTFSGDVLHSTSTGRVDVKTSSSWRS